MPTPTLAQVAPTQYLSLKEAVVLGYGAYSTLRAWIASGRLPAVKISNRVKVTLVDLEGLASPKIVRSDAAQKVADAAAVAAVVAAAPRLTDKDRERLAVILGGVQ